MALNILMVMIMDSFLVNVDIGTGVNMIVFMGMDKITVAVFMGVLQADSIPNHQDSCDDQTVEIREGSLDGSDLNRGLAVLVIRLFQLRDLGKEANCRLGLRNGKYRLFFAALHTFYLRFTSPWLRLTGDYAMIIL